MIFPLSIFSVDLLSDHLLLVAALLIFAAILVTKVGAKLGTPVLLLFLLLGLAVGADGLGVKFENHKAAESIGHFAMTIILFAGGLGTSLKQTRPVMKQGILLSSLGVFLTMLITGGFIAWIARPLLEGTRFLWCFLLAAVVSSTDSASVFSILRGKRLHLRENVGPMLELESGSNDPMAYLLTIVLVKLLEHTELLGETPTWALAIVVGIILVLQIGIGFGVGYAIGKLSVKLLDKINLQGSSLYGILLLSIAFLADGLASLLKGNGLLALYVAAIIIGNKANLPEKKDIGKFFDGMTWLMQLVMFLMLGLLARPSEMGNLLLPAMVIGLFMMLVARPVSVFICLAPFRKLSLRAKTLVSWVGLKGAGPILFALCPVVAGLPGGTDIFNIVFCITLLSLLLQGMTLSPLAKSLNMSYEDIPETKTFGLEVPEEMGMLRDHLVTEGEISPGTTLRDMHLPHGIRVVMVRRDGKFLVPHGSMEILEGDHLLIIMGETDD